MKRLVILYVFILHFATGCASAPSIYHVDSTMEVNAPVDRILDSIDVWLPSSDFEFVGIDRSSGTIKAVAHFEPLKRAWEKHFTNKWADCYRKFLMIVSADDLSLDIDLRESNDKTSTQITIDPTFQRTYEYDSPVLLSY